ncbi:hypothetical protein P5V15_013302 [Pogonomyrmex californicus]
MWAFRSICQRWLTKTRRLKLRRTETTRQNDINRRISYFLKLMRKLSTFSDTSFGPYKSFYGKFQTLYIATFVIYRPIRQIDLIKLSASIFLGHNFRLYLPIHKYRSG